MKLLEAMRRQGVVPNIITYNALISACEKGKKFGRAFNVCEAMLRQGIMPDIVGYTALISTCDK